jgi:ABC-type dipeptide/oligopeptide/nickel transport system permease subunit
MVVAIFFGVLVGAVAGMSSGRVDAALMWVTDLFLSLPQLPLLLLVIYLFREPVKGVMGVEGGAFVLIVAVIGGGCRRPAWCARSSSPCAKRNSSRRLARWVPRGCAR